MYDSVYLRSARGAGMGSVHPESSKTRSRGAGKGSVHPEERRLAALGDVPSPKKGCFGDGHGDFEGSVTKNPMFWRQDFKTIVAGNTPLPLTAFHRGCVFPALTEGDVWRQLFPAGAGNNYRLRGDGLSPARQGDRAFR